MDENNLTPQQEKLNILKQVFPEAFSEQKIDWKKLKAALGANSNADNEPYVLNWAGKNEAFRLVYKPVAKTLIPLRHESINFDATRNIFIEGENLEVLKTLQKSYFGKVKTIYIDPPYNTGSDAFVYSDKFAENKTDYQKRVGSQAGSPEMMQEGIFHQNSKDNGHYHSNWLSMMLPRLHLARNLLRPDGAIFISIDDNEVHNLRLLLNEVFGEENFRNIFSIRRYDKNLNRQFIARGLKSFNVGFEYVLCYARSEAFNFNPVYKKSSDQRQTQGYWKGFWNDADRPTMRYDILGFTPETGQWKWKKETALLAVRNYEEFLKNHAQHKTLEEYWEETGKALKFIRRNPAGRGKNKGVENWIAPSEGKLRNTNWTDLMASKHEPETKGLFDFPKNKEMISLLLNSACGPDDLVLDFFAGSGTTAHAVLDLNRADGGKRNYICVQLAEPCNEKSAAKQAGFTTVAELSKERIRRVSARIKQEIEAEMAGLRKKIENLQNKEPGTKQNDKLQEYQHRLELLSAQDTGVKVFRLAEHQTGKTENSSSASAGKAVGMESMAVELLLKNGKELHFRTPAFAACNLPECADTYTSDDGKIVVVLAKITTGMIEKIVEAKPIKVLTLHQIHDLNPQKSSVELQLKKAGIEFETVL